MTFQQWYVNGALERSAAAVGQAQIPYSCALPNFMHPHNDSCPALGQGVEARPKKAGYGRHSYLLIQYLSLPPLILSES